VHRVQAIPDWDHDKEMDSAKEGRKDPEGQQKGEE
jgi:hypothetical protein